MWSWALLLAVMVVNHSVVVAPNSNPGAAGQPTSPDPPTTPDPPPTEAPTTEGPATTEEPTTTKTTTTTAAPQPNNRICPANSGMVDATRVMAKTAHNYRRGRLARGEVRNKAGRNLPTATNMLRLEYSCTLETSAATSAQRCPSASSSPSNGVHENVHLFSKSQAGSEKDAIVVAVKQWWSRIRVTGGVGQGVTYTQYNVGQPTEWFIRMAWASTQHFGCAVVSCGSNWSVVCHYQTGGSVGQMIYNKGSPCSACPDNTFCNEDKLCQLLSKF